jgi:hypothetical protein
MCVRSSKPYTSGSTKRRIGPRKAPAMSNGAVLHGKEGCAAQTVLAHVDEGAIPLAVVKGNGYGHGLTIAAQVFADVGFKELGVADLNEAITLRQARRRRLQGGLRGACAQ